MLEDILRQASLTIETASTLLRRMATMSWIQGTEVTVTVAAGQTSGTARHGLGRAMNGAVIVGATDASRTVSVDLSNSTSLVTVRLSAASGSDFSVKLRVY